MTKRQLVIISSVSLLATGLLVLLFFQLRNSNQDTQNSNNVSETSDTSQSSDVPISKVDIIKKNEANTTPSPAGDGSSPASVTPFISFAGVISNFLEINAYMTILESGGKCKAIVTNQSSGSSKSKTVETLPDASKTPCKLISFPLSELKSGMSSVVVKYTSAKYSGSSEKLEVNIP